MSALHISQLFKNISFYQEHYLSILNNPEQYYLQVEQAYLDVWPFSEKKLYLGDLLQLWFSQKWLIHSNCRVLSNSQNQTTQKIVKSNEELYLFQLSGSTLSGSNHAQVWSVLEQKVLFVSLESVFKYYCYFESKQRPVLLPANELNLKH